MRVLLLGANGQVGWELRRALQPIAEVAACDRAVADLNDFDRLRALVRMQAPDLIVNAAAYTAVDRAEQEPSLAHRINADAVALLADECKRTGALLIHYSTAFVFDGNQSAPYRETDTPNPLSAYGRVKLAGEQALQNGACDYLCFRLNWIYSARGNNFLRTILREAAQKASLQVVDDQVGAPTWARWVADATAQILVQAQKERREKRFASEVLHLSCDGHTSRHGFAMEAIDCWRQCTGQSLPAHIEAVSSERFPALARRPFNSQLNCSRVIERYGLSLPQWQLCVNQCVQELAAKGLY